MLFSPSDMMGDDPFADASTWSLGLMALGYYSPTVIGYLQNDRWPKWLKVTVTLLFHAVTSFLYMGSTGKLTGLNGTPTNYFMIFLQLAFFTQLSYQHVWSATKVNLKTLPKVFSLSHKKHAP